MSDIYTVFYANIAMSSDLINKQYVATWTNMWSRICVSEGSHWKEYTRRMSKVPERTKLLMSLKVSTSVLSTAILLRTYTN
jgi:hypothetical protein